MRYFTILIIILTLIVGTTYTAFASRIDEIRDEISVKNNALQQLEREIAKYQEDLQEIGRESTTLEFAIAKFDASIRRLNTDISITQSKAETTALRIEALEIAIEEQERLIKSGTDALGESIRRMNEAEDRNMVELLLSSASLSNAWDEVESIQKFQRSVENNLANLQLLKDELAINKDSAENERHKVLSLQRDFNAKKKVEVSERNKKDTLLDQTKNKESEYQKLLEERITRKEAFEEEILNLESELKLEIDPTSYPAPKKGILRWPLDEVRLTQEFGDTEFSRKNPGVYKGKGHNGIDMGAPLGTPIKSASSGVVWGTGNTDSVKGCYSYGKWVLVRHNNGLSSLYAHLSLISLSKGESVNAGDILGYSGNTGYSTGPHLHFTVYASQGVQIKKFDKSINCKDATIPIADLKAYMNPMLYLPEIE